MRKYIVTAMLSTGALILMGASTIKRPLVHVPGPGLDAAMPQHFPFPQSDAAMPLDAATVTPPDAARILPAFTAIPQTTQNLTVYVDVVNGDDGNTGDITHPLKTITYALAHVPPIIGHTVLIYLANGTYPENLELAFTFKGNGTLAIEGQNFVTYVPDAGSQYGSISGTADGGLWTYPVNQTAADGGTYAGAWAAHSLRGKFVQVLTGRDAPGFLPIADNSTSSLEIPDYADNYLYPGTISLGQQGAIITGDPTNNNPIISVDSVGGSDVNSTYSGNPTPAGAWGSAGSLQINSLTISDNGSHGITPIRVASGKIVFSDVAIYESGTLAGRDGTQQIFLINTAIGTSLYLMYSYVGGQIEAGGGVVLIGSVAGAVDTVSGSFFSSCPNIAIFSGVLDGKILDDTAYGYTDVFGLTGNTTAYLVQTEMMNGHYGCMNLGGTSQVSMTMSSIHDCANYYGIYTGHAGQDINTGITMSADTTFKRNSPTDIYVGTGTPDGGMSIGQLRALPNKVFRDPITNAAVISQ